MRTYPSLQNNKPESLKAALDFIARERVNDVADRNNFPNIFMSGRKVAKIPSGSTDTAVTDRIGDFNYTTAFLYLCASDSGTATWRRFAGSSF
jgi:hypothetical protein